MILASSLAIACGDAGHPPIGGHSSGLNNHHPLPISRALIRNFDGARYLAHGALRKEVSKLSQSAFDALAADIERLWLAEAQERDALAALRMAVLWDGLSQREPLPQAKYGLPTQAVGSYVLAIAVPTGATTIVSSALEPVTVDLQQIASAEASDRNGLSLRIAELVRRRLLQVPQ